MKLHCNFITVIIKLQGNTIKEQIFENLCFNEIRKALTAGAPTANIHFWRTAGGAEVDFIIERNNRLIPIEVKLSESAREGDVKNLLKFKTEYPNKVSNVILLYNGPFQYHEPIIFLPFWLI